MRQQILLLFIFFIKFSLQQLPDQKKIDDECAECRNSMIYIESRIAYKLSNFSDQIQKCVDDLKAANGPKTILDALENLKIVASQIQSVKNFEPYESIETCSQINLRIILMDIERSKMNWIVQQLTTNISLLTQRNSQLITQYSLNLNRALPYLSTLERKVYEIFTTTPKMITELLAYLPTLQICIGKMSTMTALMNAFRTKYCQCLATVSWTSTSNGSSLSTNLLVLENQLQTLQSRLSNFSSSAITLVKRASSETGNVYLPPLQVVLERQNRSDFPNTSWPNVQNCNDLFNRGKFLASKQLQYLRLMPQSNLDCSLISFYLNALSSTSSSSASLNNAISAVRSVESTCRNYNSLLVAAFVRVSVMSGNVNTMGDTFCTCGVITTTTSTSTTTTTTTTSTTTTTTTTLPPFCVNCGDLYPMDATYDPSNPSTPGFASGTWIDGSTFYPGVADFANCSPNRVARINAPLGAYSPCGPSEFYSTTSVKYFCNHPQLSWVTTSIATASNIVGRVVQNAGTAQLIVTRFNVTNASGTYQQIGYIWQNNGNGIGYYDGSVGQNSFTGNVEVLACGAVTTTSTTTTTTQTPSTTTLKPCPSGARRVITDVNGNYLKTACMIKTAQTQASGEASCQSIGYSGLYVVESADESAKLSAFAYSVSPGHYNINGVRAANGTWFCDTPEVACFEQPSGTCGGSIPVGDCMAFSSQLVAGTFVSCPKSCTNNAWCICEG